MTRQARERIRSGELRGASLLAWIGEHPSDSRDRALEELLGIARPVDQLGGAPGADRMPYMPSAIAPVVRAVLDVPITRDDVFVDLGAGLGKAAMTVHLLTGARARGVELQPALVTAANAQARELALGVEFVRADALEADLDDATVVFLYLPFTGEVLAGVLRRLEAVARRRQLVICTLGLHLRGVDWIAERPTEEFWLSIYESRIPGAVPRPPGSPSPLAALGEAIACER